MQDADRDDGGDGVLVPHLAMEQYRLVAHMTLDEEGDLLRRQWEGRDHMSSLAD